MHACRCVFVVLVFCVSLSLSLLYSASFFFWIVFSLFWIPGYAAFVVFWAQSYPPSSSLFPLHLATLDTTLTLTSTHDTYTDIDTSHTTPSESTTPPCVWRYPGSISSSTVQYYSFPMLSFTVHTPPYYPTRIALVVLLACLATAMDSRFRVHILFELLTTRNWNI